MDQDELEDGEISDSDEETQEITAGSLTVEAKASTSDSSVLPRPTNPAMSFRVPQEAAGLPPAHAFRDSPAGLAGDDSDADSDGSDLGIALGKRPKLDPAAVPAAKKRNIWADVLLEDQLTSKIRSGGRITAEDAADPIERGVESYIPSGESRTLDVDAFDVAVAQDAEFGGELWNVNEDGETLNTVKKRTGKKKKKKKKHSVKDRLDLDYEANSFDGYQDELDYAPDDVCADDDERVISRYIARHLNEPKVILIERVTRFTGREKTLELFNATMDVEAAGGMMNLQGNQRRTPGGVFLQLLKKDKDITRDTVRDIFAVERENQKFAKKVLIKDRQMRKRKYYNKEASEGTGETTAATASDNTMDAIEDFELMEEPDIEIGVTS